MAPTSGGWRHLRLSQGSSSDKSFEELLRSWEEPFAWGPGTTALTCGWTPHSPSVPGYCTHHLLSCSAKSRSIKLLSADMVNISSPR